MNCEQIIDGLIQRGHQNVLLCAIQTNNPMSTKPVLEYLITSQSGVILARNNTQTWNGWLSVHNPNPAHQLPSSALYDFDLNKRNEACNILRAFS